MSNKLREDPRDSTLETKVTLPNKWDTGADGTDFLATMGMFLSGLILVTRNRYLAWPALLLGLNALVNMHPLRQKEGSTGPWSAVALAGASCVASYLPYFLMPPGSA